jgi:DNA-binding Xre family transcriptional regulator
MYAAWTSKGKGRKMERMITCKLKSVLQRKGWTRYKLHKKSGISYPALHSLFHDRTESYDRRTLDLLCATLRCQPKDLLQWKLPVRFPRLK